MRFFPLLLFGFFLSFALSAQDRPVFFPEDIDPSTLHLKCLCKPGVTNKSRSRGIELSYIQSLKGQFEQEDGFPLSEPLSELTIRNLIFKLRFPVINRDGFKVIAGMFYRPEQYDFQKIGNDYSNIFQHLNNRPLKNSGFEGLVIKSWNETFYSSLRIRTMFNGDYKGLINFDNRYSIFNASALFGVKKADDKEWGLGLSFSSSFRSTIALPFFLYNHTFNDKWGVEMVLPALVSVRYNLSDYSLLLFGMRYNSRSYAIETDDTFLPQRYHLNHSEIQAGFSLEQKIHSWVWLDVAAGVQYNFSTDFAAVNNTGLPFEVEPSTVPIFKIGIFISPPDSFIK